MKAILVIVFAIFLLMPISVYASQPTRLISRTYNIELIVEDMDEVLEAVRALPGFNLQSNVSQVDAPQGQITRQANFTRRIDNWAFNHAQSTLRELGEILRENEQAQHHGAEIAQLETRIAVLTQEIERLTIMMAASTTLDVLITIDSHLSRVMRDRDRLTGQRNQRMAQTQSVVTVIRLTERVEYAEEEEEEVYEEEEDAAPTFTQRIADSFFTSWDNFTRRGSNLAVFVARVGLPFLIWLAVIGLVLLIILRTPLKRYIKSINLRGGEPNA
ncbi:MAG: DUF4349 domain-containing protein [Defluviitaleaceae bacterium]|nr:DUF4349 domain-containing protein [Defluviitaleaceae bacterium]MCL2276221.1 DUF4349 domain-containing protein [Defluviitaleaceae bacterium]